VIAHCVGECQVGYLTWRLWQATRRHIDDQEVAKENQSILDSRSRRNNTGEAA
jgi:hypothetical protein